MTGRLPKGKPTLYLSRPKTEKTRLGPRLSNLIPDEKPWDRHRRQTQRIEHLYDEISTGSLYSQRLAKCAEMLRFSYDGQWKLIYAYYCRVRTCPVCQWRRSMAWKARFYAAVPKIKADYPTNRWIFATFTVRNCPLSELRGNINHINKSFARMSELKRWPAIGWVRAIEITRNLKTDEAHPHIHCLMLVKPGYFKHNYLSQATWTAIWQKSARLDYTPIVDIRAIKAKDKQGADGIEQAVLETLKYSVKPSDLTVDSEWLAQFTEQIHKTRAVSVGGVLRKYLKAEEPDPTELTAKDNGKGPTLPFTWNRERQEYRNSKAYDERDMIL